MTQHTTKQEKYSIQTADPVWLREEADRVIRFFAERLKDVDIVQEVRYTYEVGGVTAWVITDGPEGDFRSEKPVDRIAGDAIRMQKAPLFDYRVFNLNDFTPYKLLYDSVPIDAVTLWKRKHA